MIKRKEKPLIKIISGRWYALKGTNKILLPPAIGWCNQRNISEGRK